MTRPTITTAQSVAHVTLDDGQMNLFTFETVRSLRDACLPLLEDPSIRVIVLQSGLSHVWSAGADLTEFSDPGLTFEGIAGWYFDVYDLAVRFLHSDKLVVASLARTVVGVAAALVLSCDFRVFSTKANLFLPEARLGLVAPLFSADLLMATVGMEQAKRLLIECPKVTGPEALALGLATRVLEFDAYGEEFARFAAMMASRDALSVGVIKRHLARKVAWDPMPASRDAFVATAREERPAHWGEFLAALRGPAATEGIRHHLAAQR